jgi:hypothetical protein
MSRGSPASLLAFAQTSSSSTSLEEAKTVVTNNISILDERSSKTGRSALDLAVSNRATNVVIALVQAGADKTTALQQAKASLDRTKTSIDEAKIALDKAKTALDTEINRGKNIENIVNILEGTRASGASVGGGRKYKSRKSKARKV